MDEFQISTSRPFNQRIDLDFDENKDNLLGWKDDGEAGVLELDDEELTRDKVKRASGQIMAAVDRKKRKPKVAARGAEEKKASE